MATPWWEIQRILNGYAMKEKKNRKKMSCTRFKDMNEPSTVWPCPPVEPSHFPFGVAVLGLWAFVLRMEKKKLNQPKLIL